MEILTLHIHMERKQMQTNKLGGVTCLSLDIYTTTYISLEPVTLKHMDNKKTKSLSTQLIYTVIRFDIRDQWSTH